MAYPPDALLQSFLVIFKRASTIQQIIRCFAF